MRSTTAAPAPHPEPPPHPTPTHPPTADLRLVLIDADNASLQRHQRFVSQLPDMRVTAASHSSTVGAHHLLSRPAHHDLAIIAITAHNRTALKLIRQMRARDICTPVIVISTLTTPDMVHRALSLGAIDYLVAPVPFALFAQRLRQARWYCEQHTHCSNTDHIAKLTQQHIDEILEVRHPRGCSNRLNGLSPETLQLVHHALITAPHSTASNIAHLSHTSRVTARRYLEHLVNIGQARRTPQHGQIGRPSSLYHSLETQKGEASNLTPPPYA